MVYKLLLVFSIFTISSCGEDILNITTTKKAEEIKKVEYRMICDTIEVFYLDQKNGNIKFSKEIVCDTILVGS